MYQVIPLLTSALCLFSLSVFCVLCLRQIPTQAENIVDTANVNAFICASIKLYIINTPYGVQYEIWDTKAYNDMRNYLVPAVFADSAWMK
jgi:hypothetical protein